MAEHTLSIILNTEKEYHFHLHELTLKEGISQISDAHLTLYSTVDITMADLNKLISSPAAVKITQSDTATAGKSAEKQENCRWYQGMITSVKHCGVVEKTVERTVKKIEMRVQSPIQCLKYAFRKRHKGNITPREMIEDILKDHNLVCEFSDPLPDVKRDFNQGNSSDYDFLMRILLQYQMNYIFQSTVPAADNTAAFPKMYLFKNSVKSVASMIPEQKDIVFLYALSDRDLWTMRNWEMGSSIGIDAVSMQYENSSGNSTVLEPENSSDGRLCCFDFSVFGEKDTAAVINAAKTLLHCYQCDQYYWKGQTPSFAAIPGLKIAVQGFYGGEDKIEAIVASGHLKVTSQWPTELGAAPKTTPELKLTVNCLDPAAVKEFICAPDSDVVNCVRNLTEGNTDIDYSRTNMENICSNNLVTAVVCTAEGKISENTTAPLITDDYEFYALIDGDKNNTPAKVKLTVPLGGYKQGLFRSPRCNERVLLHQTTANTYYLAGYLPNKTDMPFADDLTAVDKAFNSNEMTVLRHNEPEKNLTDVKGYLPAKAPANAILNSDNSYDKAKSDEPNKISEFGIYSGVSGDNIDEKYQKTLVNMASTGNLHLSSNNTTEIRAKNIKISTPGWKECQDNRWDTSNGVVQFDDFNILEVNASQQIIFKVGNNSISITPNGIAIRALKWTGVPGPMDSAIYMDSIAGISISGMNCSMSGYLGSGISDGLGNNMKVGAGGACITGGVVDIKTADKIDTCLSLGNTIFQEVLQLSSMIATTCTDRYGDETSKERMEQTDNWFYGIKNIVDVGLNNKGFARDLIKVIKDRDCENPASFVIKILDCVTGIINLVWLSADAWASRDWLNTPLRKGDKLGNFSGRDMVRLLAFCTNLSAWSIGVGMLLSSMSFNKTAKLKIKSTGIELDVDKLTFLTQKFEELNSVIAGLVK